MRFTAAVMTTLAALAPALAQSDSLDSLDLGLPECLQSCITDNVQSLDDLECSASDLTSTDDAKQCVCDTLKNNDDLLSCIKGCDDDESSDAISQLDCDGLNINSEDAAMAYSAPAFLAAGGLVAALFL